MSIDEATRRVARAICAQSGMGFCWQAGETFGCKVGRGETPHWSRCVATDAQLFLGRHIDQAEDAIHALNGESLDAMYARRGYVKEA